MPRTFNTTGPCRADFHYLLPPEQRLPALLPFVEENLYFVLHAARQTGKTTAMLAFAKRLREQGYAAVYQDTRGRYGSEGVDRVYADDAPDGYDTLDWIAAQPNLSRADLQSMFYTPSTPTQPSPAPQQATKV